MHSKHIFLNILFGMRLPDFVLSLDNRVVIRVTEPSFELRIVLDEEIPDLPSPKTIYELNDGRRFGIVKWIGDLEPYKPEELERFAQRATEYLIDRWNEEAPTD